jgi:hypothetical protein
MKSTVVFATANSRLHADIMMIRLRRAGISIDRISAIFSRCFAPNTFFFWLRKPRALVDRNEQSFFVAGPIQRLFGRRDDVDSLPHKLTEIGLERRAADHLGDSLHMGNAMLCVQVKNKDELEVAFDIFHHSKAENIVFTGSRPAVKAEPKRMPSLINAWMPTFTAA